MKINQSIAAMAAAILVGGVANAQTSVVHTNETVGTSYNNFVNFVDKFTLNTGSTTIQSIGLYNPFGTPQSVEVRKNGGSLQTITGANGASGNVWKYANLTTPILMNAGDYIEVFFTNQAGTQNYAYGAGPINPNFTVLAKYSTGVGDTYATVSSGGINYGTLAVSTLSDQRVPSAVPEPGEWAAMGILGAGLAGLVIRKRRNG